MILHGIARSSSHMDDLAQYLTQEGYDVLNIDYPSTKHPLEVLSHLTYEKLSVLFTEDKPVHFVGYTIKGASQIGKCKPLVSKFSKANKLRVKLFSIGTDTAKQMIYARLKIHQPCAGYCHFPADYPVEYFKQLTAERIQTRFVNGHPTRI